MRQIRETAEMTNYFYLAELLCIFLEFQLSLIYFIFSITISDSLVTIVECNFIGRAHKNLNRHVASG